MASRTSLANYIHNYWVRYINLMDGGKPGFAHGMKIFYNTVDLDRLSFGDMSKDDTLTYRYQLSDDVPKFTTGLLFAAMDELTTWACFRKGQPSRPGLSLQLQTELVDKDLSKYQELDIINKVTKMGKSISHTRTDIVCPHTDKTVAFASHVKFMPMGDKVMNEMLQNNDMLKQYVDEDLEGKYPEEAEEKPLFDGVIRPFLDYLDHGKATFQTTREHTNPFDSMHGGCHGMVMEEVATRFAQTELGTENVINESMQVEYLGVTQGEVTVTCEKVGMEDDTIHVRVLIEKDGRICSEGKLRLTGHPE